VIHAATIRPSTAAGLLLLRSRLHALSPACDAAGKGFQCRLTGLLHLLYAAAGLLALLLLIVIALALGVYRRNRAAQDNTGDGPDA
jgi:uncharacterized membrane protein YqjE